MERSRPMRWLSRACGPVAVALVAFLAAAAPSGGGECWRGVVSGGPLNPRGTCNLPTEEAHFECASDPAAPSGFQCSLIRAPLKSVLDENANPLSGDPAFQQLQFNSTMALSLTPNVK